MKLVVDIRCLELVNLDDFSKRAGELFFSERIIVVAVGPIWRDHWEVVQVWIVAKNRRVLDEIRIKLDDTIATDLQANKILPCEPTLWHPNYCFHADCTIEWVLASWLDLAVPFGQPLM